MIIIIITILEDLISKYLVFSSFEIASVSQVIVPDKALFFNRKVRIFCLFFRKKKYWDIFLFITMKFFSDVKNVLFDFKLL